MPCKPLQHRPAPVPCRAPVLLTTRRMSIEWKWMPSCNSSHFDEIDKPEVVLNRFRPLISTSIVLKNSSQFCNRNPLHQHYAIISRFAPTAPKHNTQHRPLQNKPNQKSELEPNTQHRYRRKHSNHSVYKESIKLTQSQATSHTLSTASSSLTARSQSS